MQFLNSMLVLKRQGFPWSVAGTVPEQTAFVSDEKRSVALCDIWPEGLGTFRAFLLDSARQMGKVYMSILKWFGEGIQQNLTL